MMLARFRRPLPLPDQSRLSDSNKRRKQPTRRICARRRRHSGSARRRQRAPCRPGWSGRRRQFQFYTRALASVLALDPGPPACLHVSGPANVFFSHILIHSPSLYVFPFFSVISLRILWRGGDRRPQRGVRRGTGGAYSLLFFYSFFYFCH